MIVCQCGVVSDREVRAVVQSGATTLSSVCRRTGAGQGCGTCVFSLKRMICDHQAEPTHAAPEVDSAAS